MSKSSGRILELTIGVPPLNSLSRWAFGESVFPGGEHTVLEPEDDLVQAALDATRARIGMRAYLRDGKKVFCPLCEDERDHWCKLQQED